jgi:hypothetical protein
VYGRWAEAVWKMNDRQLNSGTACMAKTALLAVSVLGFAIAAAGSLLAQEASGGTRSPSAQPAIAYLDYQEVSFSLSQWYHAVSARSGAFKKEPPFGRNSVTRGMLPLSGGVTNEMAFAWDRTAGVLYFDLNRNLDLTDDPAGVFTNDHRYGLNYQRFTKVHVPLKTPAGICQALVDLNCYGYGGITYNALLRSYWQGKVTLQGAEWQIGLVTQPFEQQAFFEGGSLLLRPWSEHNQPISNESGSLETFPFSQKVFVGNHAYQLRGTVEPQGNVPRVRVQFTEQTPAMGDLKITGVSVQRVTLEGGDYTVVMDRPDAVVKVPVGSYQRFNACLKKGELEARLNRGEEMADKRLVISAQEPLVLPVGGPLTNSVSVIRQGRKLSLNYELVGAGGTYQLVNQDRLHPPEFTVYLGDTKIASGKFEFG